MARAGMCAWQQALARLGVVGLLWCLLVAARAMAETAGSELCTATTLGSTAASTFAAPVAVGAAAAAASAPVLESMTIGAGGAFAGATFEQSAALLGMMAI